MSDDLPNVRFGNYEAAKFDWRAHPELDVDPDDDELAVTPPDVVAMLGFDPKGRKVVNFAIDAGVAKDGKSPKGGARSVTKYNDNHDERGVAKRRQRDRLKRLDPIPFERKATKQAIHGMKALWSKVFDRQAQVVRAHVLATLSKDVVKYDVAKADEPPPGPPSLTPEQQAAIDAMVADITLDLTDEQVAELEAYLSTIVGDTGSLAYAQVNLDATGSFFEHLHAEALKWAEQNAADLVSGIADTTRDQVRQAIVDGYLNNLSVAEIADSIESIGAFSADRATLIASTEIAAANSAGSLSGYRQAQSNGVSVLKQWLNADTSDVCDDCQENADEGPIDLDQTFPSGDDAPPNHPHCHCAICPVVVDDTGDEAPADTAPADAALADEDFADSEDA